MGYELIEIDPFSDASINKALNRLQKIKQEWNEKVDKFIHEITEVGAWAAAKTYGTEVDVRSQDINGGRLISANGRMVCFLEFGAGSATDEGAKYADKMPFPVARGSYSDDRTEHGGDIGPYAKSGYEYWEFGGVRMTMVRRRPGMKNAYEAIVNKTPEIAKKVFG